MKEKSERRNCVKCGKNLSEDQKLRCGDCIKLVNEELEGKADREWRYYFRHHLKQMKKTFKGDKNV